MHKHDRLNYIVGLGLEPAQQSVLIALNDWANHKDHRCCPSIETIARRAVVSKRTVERTLVKLNKAGHVLIESGKRQREVNWYVLVPRMLDSAKMAQVEQDGDSANLTDRTNYIPAGAYAKRSPRPRVNPATRALFQVLDGQARGRDVQLPQTLGKP